MFGVRKAFHEIVTALLTIQQENERLESENGKLKELAKGLLYCLDDHLDAHDCPLYDEGEPNRCKTERLIRETGLRDEDS